MVKKILKFKEITFNKALFHSLRLNISHTTKTDVLSCRSCCSNIAVKKDFVAQLTNNHGEKYSTSFRAVLIMGCDSVVNLKRFPE